MIPDMNTRVATAAYWTVMFGKLCLLWVYIGVMVVLFIPACFLAVVLPKRKPDWVE